MRRLIHTIKVPALLIDLNGAKIITDGNSITAGQGSTGGQTYPYQLSQLEGILNVVASVTNFGVGGQTTDNMIADYDTQIKPLVNTADVVVLVAWEMRNQATLQLGNGDVQNKIAQYCLQAKNDGFIVVTGTYMPSYVPWGETEFIQFEADRQINNNWIKANYRDFAHAVFDTDTIAGMSELSDTYNTGYVYDTVIRPSESVNGKFSDGTHPTNAGYSDIANLVKNTIVNIRI